MNESNSYIPHISPSLVAVYNSILNPSVNVKDRRPDHNTGNYVPYSCEQCVGSLTSHKVIMNKGCETGPTIYRPYPKGVIKMHHFDQKPIISEELKVERGAPFDFPHRKPANWNLRVFYVNGKHTK